MSQAYRNNLSSSRIHQIEDAKNNIFNYIKTGRIAPRSAQSCCYRLPSILVCLCWSWVWGKIPPKEIPCDIYQCPFSLRLVCVAKMWELKLRLEDKKKQKTNSCISYILKYYYPPKVTLIIIGTGREAFLLCPLKQCRHPGGNERLLGPRNVLNFNIHTHTHATLL